jgi:hypothetical protein
MARAAEDGIQDRLQTHSKYLTCQIFVEIIGNVLDIDGSNHGEYMILPARRIQRLKKKYDKDN